jgi:hypothetical protein
MASYPPYIPPKDADFANWVTNFDGLLSVAPTVYGLEAADATLVSAVVATWDLAYAQAIDPPTRTAPTVAAKDAARASAEAVIRPYAVQISLNAAVADLDKTAIGVTVPSLTPTPIPAPVNAPDIAIVSAIPLQQTLSFAEPGAVGKSKPFGVTGCEVFRNIGLVPATDPAQAIYSATKTKSPFRETFIADDQGKIVTYFCRWSTRSGPGGTAQFGPWSAPLTLSIM